MTNIPYWAVVIIVVVLVVGYYLVSASSREKKRESAGAEFGKIPSFHADQVFADVRAETVMGIDARGRRIAVAHKHTHPRFAVYSFGQIATVEVLQNSEVIARTARQSAVRPGLVVSTEKATPTSAKEPPSPSSGTPIPIGALFGSTRRPAAAPEVKPALGNMSTLAVRVTFENSQQRHVLINFYDGRPIDPFGAAGEKAFSEARVCLAALDVAIKRAGLPLRPEIPVRPG